jgi:endonuclease-3
MNTPQDAIGLGADKIYEFIKTINFAPKKALYILNSAQLLIKEYNGIIPKTRKELIKLPGVGMKTAGVFLLNEGFEYAFPVDTHIRRIAQSFGFTNSNNVDEIEKDLSKIFPKEQWLELHLRMISYGRKYLKARDIPETIEDAWKDLEKNVAKYKQLQS